MTEPLARDPGLAKLMAKIREDDVPCKICGELTNSLAGDPGKWPVRVYIPWIPCEPGRLWTYHQECHWKEMQKVVKLAQAAEAFMEDLGLTNLMLKALKPFKDIT